MKLRVCIPTAGTGSRLGSLVKNINKSLVAVNNKPTISHQIEYFSKDTEFVIPLGYKGDLVKKYLLIAHPLTKFYFVTVNDYTSPNSGLGLSMLKAKKYLQQPFIFLSCDTLISGKIPRLKNNWMGYSQLKNSKEYRTISIKDNLVESINEKKIIKKNMHPYIGIAGIVDYKIFWKKMSNGGHNAIQVGESYGLKELIGNKIYSNEFKWLDTGNLTELSKTRKKLKLMNMPNILEKEDEAIWFVKKKVIKFSKDREFIKNRILRTKYLNGYIPRVTAYNDNMYIYNRIEGDVLSQIINLSIFKKFLVHTDKFWLKKKLNVDAKNLFLSSCNKFYKVKTDERIKLFYKKFNKKDGNEHINNIPMPYLNEILKQINWDFICAGSASRFHGDLHFENVIYNKKSKKTTFIDWRQDFGGNIEYGDIYYDLAKLLHGMLVNHSVISKNRYSVSWSKKNIYYKIERKKILISCENYFYLWIKKNGFDVNKVKILTALIFLNIAPLHHEPYCYALYALGKDMLFKAVNNN